ncbi:Protein kinase domain-containing protein [Bordetella sputigena]|uniref:serine/threonine protein kinase n=1 Tax=Bordetella sputigena TaxID=1416810 RepID=UPI0039F0BA5D
MSVSPAFMPGAEHPAPEPFGYRPLAAIAAASAGGVPQKRIGRVISEIAPELMAAHRQGKVHGAISVHTVGLDEFGYAHLMVPALYPDHPGSMEPASCFAAVEQFDPDPVQACGPWTDVYALCAVMCSLVSGSQPPHALARRSSDQYVPLTERAPRGYDAAFLAVIDQGLSLTPALRPQSVADLCGMLGVSCVPETQEDASTDARGAGAGPAGGGAGAAGQGSARRRGAGGVAAILAGALVAAGVWAWLNRDEGPAPGAGDRVAGPVVLSSRSSSATPAPSPFAQGSSDAAKGAPAGSTGQQGPGRPGSDEAGRAAGAQSASVPTDAADGGAGSSLPAVPGTSAASAGATSPASPEAGTPAVRPARPPTVAVKVDIQPWGEIFVDGVSRGISPPVKTLNLPAGRHTVEVRNADLAPYRLSLDLKPGQPAAIRHVFQ